MGTAIELKQKIEQLNALLNLIRSRQIDKHLFADKEANLIEDLWRQPGDATKVTELRANIDILLNIHTSRIQSSIVSLGTCSEYSVYDFTSAFKQELSALDLAALGDDGKSIIYSYLEENPPGSILKLNHSLLALGGNNAILSGLLNNYLNTLAESIPTFSTNKQLCKDGATIATAAAACIVNALLNTISSDQQSRYLNRVEALKNSIGESIQCYFDEKLASPIANRVTMSTLNLGDMARNRRRRYANK